MTSIAKVVATARAAFATNRTKSFEFREQQLKAMLRMLEENENAFVEAIRQDLRKSKFESTLTEINFVMLDIKKALRNLKKWMAPEKPAESQLSTMMDDLRIYKDPYGVVLVIGAWNYPLQLIALPIVGAIAAGNCVVSKPSDGSAATSDLFARLMTEYMDNECYPVVVGGVAETSALLDQQFDFIFFTGSSHVGRIVHAAATKHLTPTVLELGGKSPVYVHESADIAKTARRLVWGKCLNAGQTCIAPDYVLCARSVQTQLIDAVAHALREFYGTDARQSPDLGRIINRTHFQRIVKLMRGTRGRIVIGGASDESEKYIEPTVLVDVDARDPIMEEEIFGPVLPILNVDSVEEAVEFINARAKPLAMYVFCQSRHVIETMLAKTSSGGVAINDTIIQCAANILPFGGVGGSGMGMYHGKYTFDTFVHPKPAYVKDFSAMGERLMGVRYPPHTDGKLRFLRMVVADRGWGGCSSQCLAYGVAFGLGVLFHVAILYVATMVA